MTDTTALIFKKLDLQGVQTLVNWAEQAGWNPGLSDAELFYAADNDGFYGCFIGDLMIGGGSIVSYDGLFGFMGFFIIQPDYRGKGYGKQFWYFRRDTLLARLNPNAAIGMDGVVAMQAFYAKGGFKIAFRDERYASVGRLFDEDRHVTTIQANDLSAVAIYDQLCFGFARLNFLTAWLTQAQARAFKYCVNGQLKGFAVVRPCVTGYNIGPLFADDFKVAEALYKACLSVGEGKTVYIDIPVQNAYAVELVKRFHAEYVFECARMYLGNPPVLALEKVFGITSFELG